MRLFASLVLVCAVASVGQAFFHAALPLSSFARPASFVLSDSQLHLSARPSAKYGLNVCMNGGMLDSILERKQKEVEELKANPPDGVEALLDSKKKVKSGKFIKAVKKPKGTISVVPQLKGGTPAKNYELNNVDAMIMSAHCYEAGAHAMSVCTDKEAFGMGYEDLKTAVKQQQNYKGNFPSPLPILAFDFFLDPIQLAVAAQAGANAVNLNQRILGDQTKDMIDAADKLGLDALVQVHSSEELAAACEAGAKLVGITNRDYDNWGLQDDVDEVERVWVKPFEETVFSIIAEVPKGVHAMAMGGVNETLMAWTLRDKGYTSVMVGEQAMMGSQAQQSQTSYSAGFNEMKGIIMAFRSKGSKKYGPTATASFYGKGEGAKEELGMISI